MTDETNPGTVEERAARAAADWRVPCSTDPNDPSLCEPKDDCVWGYEQGYLAALLATQSQPSATVQEVGRLMRNRLRHFFDGCNHTSAASYEYRNGWKGAVAAADRAILDMINDGAALTAEPAAKAGDEKLPCDIKLPPATLIRAGCSFETLRVALSNPDRPKHFPETAAERQARAVMMPQSGSVTAPSGGQSYGMLSGCMDFTEPSPPSPQPDMGSGGYFLNWREQIYGECPRHGRFPRIAPCCDDALSPPASQSVEKIREAGWMVAVHNDYRLNGKLHTFWLFTHPDGRWVKGEGETDAAALAEIAAALPHKEEATPATTERGREGLAKLVREYRPTMDKDVLHSWAQDIVAVLSPPSTETKEGGE